MAEAGQALTAVQGAYPDKDVYMTECSGDGLDNVAFENADDGSRVRVASNSSDAPRAIRVREGARRFDYTMPAKSLATFRWRRPER